MKKKVLIIILCILNISYLIYMFTVSNVILYYHTEVIKKAEYDVIVQGFFNESHYEKLLYDKNIKNIVGTFIVRTNLKNDPNEQKFYSVNFADDIINFIKMTFGDENYLIKGNYDENKVIITRDIANRLNLKVNNNIAIEINKRIYYMPIGGILDTNLKINNLIIADYGMIDNIDNEILFTQVYIEYKDLYNDINDTYIHANLDTNKFSYITKFDEISYSEEFAKTINSRLRVKKIIFTVTIVILVSISLYLLKKEKKNRYYILGLTLVTFSLILLIFYYFITLKIIVNPIKLLFMYKK